MDETKKLSIYDFDDLMREVRRSRPLAYILDDDNTPVPVENDDVGVATQWRHDHPDRWILQQDELLGCLISTVFLGYDHNYRPSGPPVLWETIIFDDYVREPQSRGEDIYQVRYTNHDDAVRGHKEAIAWLIEEKSDLMTALKTVMSE